MNKLICLLLVCFGVNAQAPNYPNDFILQCDSENSPALLQVDGKPADIFYVYTARSEKEIQSEFEKARKNPYRSEMVHYGRIEEYTYAENSKGRLFPHGITIAKYYLTAISISDHSLIFKKKSEKWDPVDFKIYRNSLVVEHNSRELGTAAYGWKPAWVSKCKLITKSEFEKIQAGYETRSLEDKKQYYEEQKKQVEDYKL